MVEGGASGLCLELGMIVCLMKFMRRYFVVCATLQGNRCPIFVWARGAAHGNACADEFDTLPLPVIVVAQDQIQIVHGYFPFIISSRSMRYNKTAMPIRMMVRKCMAYSPWLAL